MKVVIQRCKEGKVSVNNKIVNQIKYGFVILIGISKNDTEEDLNYLVNKILKLRVFDDENGIMNKSIIDIKGEILSISQFTLQAITKDGNRPSYMNAMNGDEALKLYDSFNFKLNEYIKTYPGVFGGDMILDIKNHGPVTIIIDSKNK
ncbi:MAG: D-aminoacyl-tRNA deacylase [Bacilli bacterium]|nr:D-aminoacyl-tRNA deacylase [Bacilli bacterium]MDD4407050.1 D-aminoacyl-tRNA deacylase [Bacilli bacterium]